MSAIRLLLTALLAAMLVAGCAGHAPPRPVDADESPAAKDQPPPVEQPAPPATERKSERPTLPPLPAAARSLGGQAERASQAGDQEAAADYLERALRIAPNHPVLWQNLAVVRYRQRAYRKVEGLALKSNALANGMADLQAQNWRLIAEARRLQGDTKGAAAALTEFRRLTDASNAD